ncbi:MAG: hypothetical protein IPG92_18710 [Flavobacteriales bacterium]|nr:hypothetical protein [Flavobacteriales bacterium]
MQNVEPVVLRQVRDFGQIISTTFTFLKQNWKPMVRAMALVSLPAAVIGGFLAGGAFAGFQELQFGQPSDPMELWSRMGSSFLLEIPGLLILMIGWMLVIAIVHEFLRAYHLGEHHFLSSGDLLKRGFSQLGSYFGASFLTGLLAGVGVLLCILPGVYAYTVLCLSLSCHAIERAGGSGSLGRSNQLVQGDFWPTLGLVFVIGLINGLVNMVVQLPFTIAGMIVGVNAGLDAVQNGGEVGMPGWFGVFTSISTAVQWCFQMLTYPIVAVCLCLKYFSRVEEKEGHGLQERIAGFDQA